jgi:hypothetical protein
MTAMATDDLLFNFLHIHILGKGVATALRILHKKNLRNFLFT